MSAGGYEQWARALAPTMRLRLAPVSGAPSAGRLRDRPDDERERQAAVDRLGLRPRALDPAIDRIVRLAQTMLGTQYAAATILDGDRHVFLAQAGSDHPDGERSAALCHHTIRQSGALVVPDTLDDERFAPVPAVRFYAGFPVESPDGYRVGTLCVYDSLPRTIDEAGVSLLRDLAKLVQRELARRPDARSLAGPPATKSA
jgi:GAF domain-containing protein